MRKIIIFLVLLLIIGCGGSSGDGPVEYNFKQGSGELELRLLPNAPPNTIYPNSEFKIIIEARNKASYDLTEGKVWISGVIDRYFSIFPTEQFFSEFHDGPLVGRSLVAPEGDLALIEFDGRSHELFFNAEQFNSPFFLKAEYTSTLEFVDTICINTDLYAVYDAGCNVQARKTYNGQGAPVAISDMEMVIIPGAASSVEFRMKIKNRGSGRMKSLTLNSATLGGRPVACDIHGQGSSMVFDQGKRDTQEAVIICKQLLSNQESYSTTLVVGLGYEYELNSQHRLTLAR
jgi:hypothetical protein